MNKKLVATAGGLGTKLIFATNNQNKVEEIRKVVGGIFEIITLADAGIDIDIPEPHNSLEANAEEKSKVIHALTGLSCFGEDTGLEIDALNGQPGVRTARFAGDDKDTQANMKKVLALMKNEGNRNAQFRTVISLILNGKKHLFEGICQGKISGEAKGEKGFGYDPIFVPNGATKTFAEMDMTEKNIFSHRKKAVANLIAFLEGIKILNTNLSNMQLIDF